MVSWKAKSVEEVAIHTLPGCLWHNLFSQSFWRTSESKWFPSLFQHPYPETYADLHVRLFVSWMTWASNMASWCWSLEPSRSPFNLNVLVHLTSDTSHTSRIDQLIKPALFILESEVDGTPESLEMEFVMGLLGICLPSFQMPFDLSCPTYSPCLTRPSGRSLTIF